LTYAKTTIYDFTIYRLERMIDDAWNNHISDESDAYILAEILEAYLDGMVSIEWNEGFPMPDPYLDDFYDL
jgi:hypothetical protein